MGHLPQCSLVLHVPAHTASRTLYFMTQLFSTNDDAVDFLHAEHLAVKDLFAQYQQLCTAGAPCEEKRDLAGRICQALSIHSQLEEEIFYPELREAVPAGALLDGCEVQHDMTADLVAQILSLGPHDDLVDARVIVLGEHVEHHVRREREELFVMARNSRLDLRAMADELSQRKSELMANWQPEKA